MNYFLIAFAILTVPVGYFGYTWNNHPSYKHLRWRHVIVAICILWGFYFLIQGMGTFIINNAPVTNS